MYDISFGMYLLHKATQDQKRRFAIILASGTVECARLDNGIVGVISTKTTKVYTESLICEQIVQF